MDLAELTQAMHKFVEAKGWYQPNSPKPQSARNLASSLVIEAAEVLELFQWTETPPEVDKLASELADVALYLLQIASLNGVNLEHAILDKLDINYNRDW